MNKTPYEAGFERGRAQGEAEVAAILEKYPLPRAGHTDFLITTNGPDGLWVVHPLTLLAMQIEPYADTQGMGIEMGSKIASDLIDRAREAGAEVMVVDWSPRITEANAYVRLADQRKEDAIAAAARTFEPLIEAAFAAGDRKECEKLAHQFPDPVTRSFILDRIRQTFGKTA